MLFEDIVKSMEDELLKIYNRQVARGADTGWAELKKSEIESYKKRQKSIIKGHIARMKMKLKSEVYASTRDGMSHAREFEKRLGDVTLPLRGKDNFFKMDFRKIDAIVNAVSHDFDKAGVATFRHVNDMYRKTVIKATANLASGILTVDQATDMATKDFLAQGISSITYKDGRQVNIKAYSNMALRTANKRAYLTGEGAVAGSWGVYLTQVSQYGACSDTCLPWQGQVYVDDVYSGGTKDDSKKYPLLSEAMAGGLFHPNCRHTKSPWFEGISSLPEPLDEEQVRINAEARAKEMALRRKKEAYKRLEDGTRTPATKAKYKAKRVELEKLENQIDLHTNNSVQIPLPKSFPKDEVFDFDKGYSKGHLIRSRIKIEDYREADKKFNEVMTEVFENETDFRMRIPGIEILEKINKTDGRFKNQIELKELGIASSRGMLNPEKRRQMSKDLFDHENNGFTGRDYEKYGYLSTKTEIGRNLEAMDLNAKQYGGFIINFKKDNVFNRTTFTFADSLTDQFEFVPSKVSDPRITSLRSYALERNAPSGGTRLEWIKNNMVLGKTTLKDSFIDLGFAYIEAQYHGDLTLDDIQDVMITMDPFKESFMDYKNKHKDIFEVFNKKDINVSIIYSDRRMSIEKYLELEYTVKQSLSSSR